MRRLLALAGLFLAATACASPPEPEPPFPGSQQQQPAPPPAEAASVPAASEPAAPQSGPSKDACGAAAVQNLVGRPRTEIPVPIDPARQRVACTTCPITQDYRPDRLNFFFDAGTGVIREIRCG